MRKSKKSMAQTGWELPQLLSWLRTIADDAHDQILLFDEAFRFLFINRAGARAMGHEPGDVPGRTFVELGFPPELAERLTRTFAEVRDSGAAGTVEYEAPQAGGMRVLQSHVNPVRAADGSVKGFFVVTRDTTEAMQAKVIRDSQDEVLRLMVSGASLAQLVEKMVALCEQYSPRRSFSMLLLSADGRRLESGCAPGLPPALVAAITGRDVGPENGCCGAAATTRERAIARDIATDPKWAAHRDLALAHGLRACCSEPILASDGKLLGTVAMYLRKPRAPYERELVVLKEAALQAAAAIQYCRSHEASVQLTEALRTGEERLDRALQASALGMWDWNIETSELYVDRHFAAMMGYPVEAMSSKLKWLLDQIHPEDQPRLLDAFSAHLKGSTPFCEGDFRGRTLSGQWKWLHFRGQVTQRNADGWAVRMTGTNQDIDEQRHNQARLDRANRRVQALLDATDEGIIGLDQTGACTFVNPAALRLLDAKPEQLIGRDLSDLLRHVREGSSEELIGHESPIHRCLTEGRRYRGGADDLFIRGERSFPVELSVCPIYTGTEGAGAVLAFHDVSDKRTLSKQLNFQALHDPLTGVLNRRGFEDKLNALLGTAKTENRTHSLCYVDLDQFKVVNDTCGHVAGDDLLRQLPAVLKTGLRDKDAVARLGGDEFAVLLEDCPLETAARVAGAVRDAVREFRFAWQYRSFAVGASLGVVGITAESQGATSVLAAADAACYVAKAQGSNHIHVSYPHDQAIVRLRGEMRWVARLRQALEEDQFRLHYQSIAELQRANGPPTKHELLLRLQDSKGELILPGAFLPAAERFHLIADVDLWVVDRALAQIGQMLAANPALRGHRFGINLSGETVRDERIMPAIEQGLARHRVPAEMIYFEITETVAIANLRAASGFMQGLRQLGCRLALDDFGSGMSSFSYLKNLPVDYLKIDGAFIKGIVDSRVDQAIVRAALAVARELRIATVAEWVESDSIVECIRAIGVDYGQGFAIAKPIPLDKLLTLRASPAPSLPTATK